MLLAGCSSGSGSGTGSGCAYDSSLAGVSVQGEAGKEPAISITDATPAAELGVKDLCPGDGATVTADSTVTVNYAGVALSTGKTFDSSYGGSPATFPLNQVIPGWSQGLIGMREGGSRLLVIPGELAYGEFSPTPDIGPNETLVFVVDLLEIR